MKMTEKRLRDYLLGTLTDDEQAELEDRAFGDPAFLAEVEAAESELIDEYVRGKMPQNERRIFERMFLASPERRSKVSLARMLARAADEHVPERAEQPRSWFLNWRPRLQLAGALAMVAIVAGLAVEDVWLRQERDAIAQRNDALKRQPVEQPKQAPGIASLILLPGVSRAESRPVSLAIQPDVQLARIEVQLEARDAFPRYKAELRTAAGTEVLVMNNVANRRSAGGIVLTVDLPASALVTGPYELAVRGVANRSENEIGYYYFSVEKK